MAKKIDHLITQFREFVFTLEAGARLPSIRDLMARFSVSQLLVGKATDALKRDGLLVARAGGELFVADKLDRLRYLEYPSLLVAIPRWQSHDIDVIRRFIEANAQTHCPGHRLKLIEYDPLLPLPYELPATRENAVGAVMYASGAPLSPETISRLHHLPEPVPFTVIGQHLEDFGIPSVGVDDALAGSIAMDHLIRAGHRRIAILYCEPHSRVIDLRCNNALGYARLQGVEPAVIDVGIVAGEFAARKTYVRIKELLRQGFAFTALAGLSGEPTLAAVDALLEGGVDVPGRLSVVTIANENVTCRHEPPIDTVGVMIEQQLRAAIQTVLPGAEPIRNRIVMPELLPYGSVRPAASPSPSKGVSHEELALVHLG